MTYIPTPAPATATTKGVLLLAGISRVSLTSTADYVRKGYDRGRKCAYSSPMGFGVGDVSQGAGFGDINAARANATVAGKGNVYRYTPAATSRGGMTTNIGNFGLQIRTRIDFYARFSLSVLASNTFEVGLCSSTSFNTNDLIVMCRSNGTNFTFECGQVGQAGYTTQDSGIPVDTAIHAVFIETPVGGGNPTIYLLDANDVVQASYTFTTNVPVNTTVFQAYCGIRRDGNALNWDVYYIECGMD